MSVQPCVNSLEIAAGRRSAVHSGVGSPPLQTHCTPSKPLRLPHADRGSVVLVTVDPGDVVVVTVDPTVVEVVLSTGVVVVVSTGWVVEGVVVAQGDSST